MSLNRDQFSNAKAPSASPRHHYWANVPDVQWHDWKWQLSNRLNSAAELAQVIHLTAEELAGVNDHPNTMLKLCHELVKMRVRPYYLYQCDLVQGSGHFRTTIATGIEIIEHLRGHTSGYAVPTFCVDLPGGGGKVPVMPNYLLSQSHDRMVFRNFEGYISTYTEPTDYQRPKKTRWVPDSPTQTGQGGVAGLLRGDHMAIKPAGWDDTHEREPSAALNDDFELTIRQVAAELRQMPDVKTTETGQPIWIQI